MDATVTSNSTIELLNGDNNYFDDSVSYFIIDARTRKITVPKDFVTLGVESDADSERIWFKCLRYVGDKVDLTTRNIYINYENANGEKDSWYSDDVVVDGDNIHFSWKIQKKVVSYKGNVKFIVCAMSTDDEGKKNADWNTTICTASVLEGLEVENPEPPAEEYDLINQLIDVTRKSINDVESISAQTKEDIETKRVQSIEDVDTTKDNALGEIESAKKEVLEYIGSGVDKTLSKENLAADAKATGDALLNLAIKPTASGSLLSLPDSEEQPLQGMKIFGKTKQATTTGKNKLPYPYVSKGTINVNGVVFKDNGDGSVTCSGTCTSTGAGFVFSSNFPFEGGKTYSMTPPSNNVYMYCNYLDETGKSTWALRKLTWKEGYSLKSIYLQVDSGNTASGTFYPIIVEGDSYDGIWEPYTGGMPSPNPDYPQEIKSVGDDGSVEQVVCGKQLIPFPYSDNRNTISGVTFTVNDDRSITIDGTSTNSLFYRICFDYYLPAGTYRLSGCHGGSGNTYFTYIEDVSTTKTICSDLGSGSSVTVGDGIFRIYLTVKSGVTVSNATIKPMLRLASITDNTYEPYKSQSLIISTPNGLSGIPVSSGGNYTDENGQQYVSDEIDLERGVKVQRVGEYRNTGEAMSMYTNAPINERGIVYWNHYLGTTTLPNGTYTVRCNFFRDGSYDAWPNMVRMACTSGHTYLYFSLSFETVEYGTTYATVKEAITAWLAKTFSADNPLIVKYRLAEPIETPLTEEEIAAYKALHTNYPNTTIYNDDGAYTEVKYVADTKNYVDNKIANEVVKLTATITT